MTMTPPNEDNSSGHVVVTLAQIYSVVLEVQVDVSDIKTALTEVSKKTEDHETRIRALERRVWAAGGAGGAIGGFLTYLISILK